MIIKARLEVDDLIFNDLDVVLSPLYIDDRGMYLYDTTIQIPFLNLVATIKKHTEWAEEDYSNNTTLKIEDGFISVEPEDASGLLIFEEQGNATVNVKLIGTSYRCEIGCFHGIFYCSGIDQILRRIVLTDHHDRYNEFAGDDIRSPKTITQYLLEYHSEGQAILAMYYTLPDIQKEIKEAFLEDRMTPKTAFFINKFMEMCLDPEISVAYEIENKLLNLILKNRLFSVSQFETYQKTLAAFYSKHDITLSKYEVCEPITFDEIYEFHKEGVNVEKFLSKYIKSSDTYYDLFPNAPLKKKFYELLIKYPQLIDFCKDLIFTDEEAIRKLSHYLKVVDTEIDYKDYEKCPVVRNYKQAVEILQEPCILINAFIKERILADDTGRIDTKSHNRAIWITESGKICKPFTNV
jgi:hypothetical protein